MNNPFQSQSELSKEQIQLILQRAREHLVDFEIATDPRYDPNWHHELVAKELEHIEQYGDRDYKILVIDEPPRHGKSQQISIDFPAWYIGRNPDREVITSSYSGDLAQDFGGKTKEKVDGNAFRAIFPTVKLKEDEKAKAKWSVMVQKDGAWIPAKGGYRAVGVGGPITGRGANVAIVDDPIKNREEADSEVMREKLWQWFTSTLFTRLEPGGVVIVMHTRWHMDDLAGRILANPEFAPITKHIHLPAISGPNDPYRKENQALWPKKYDRDALLGIKKVVGPYDWASLYQGNPVLTENQEFKPEWYRYRDEVELSWESTRRFLTVDTAMSKLASADYTGFCDNRVNSQNFWHFKAWRLKLAPEELVSALFSLHTANNYEAIGIEQTTFTMGLKPYLDAEQRRRNVFLPIVPLKHNSTAKEIRIRGLIPRYAAGSIVHIKGHTEDLEEEQRHFPVGIHDDVLDAAAYQLQIADVPDLVSASANMIARPFIPDLD